MINILKAELRLYGWYAVSSIAVLVVLFAVITTDILAATLAIAFLVPGSAIYLFSKYREKRDRLYNTLPVPRLIVGLARQVPPIVFTIVTLVAVYFVMQLPTYERFHSILPQKLVALGSIMLLYYSSSLVFTDMRGMTGSTLRTVIQNIYPGILIALWLFFYMSFITSRLFRSLFNSVAPNFGVVMEKTLFETWGGALSLLVFAVGTLAIELIIFRNRSSYVNK